MVVKESVLNKTEKKKKKERENAKNIFTVRLMAVIPGWPVRLIKVSLTLREAIFS